MIRCSRCPGWDGPNCLVFKVPQQSTTDIVAHSPKDPYANRTPEPSAPPTPSVKYLLQFTSKPTTAPTTSFAYFGVRTPAPTRLPQKIIGITHHKRRIVEPAKYKHSHTTNSDAALFSNLENQLHQLNHHSTPPTTAKARSIHTDAHARRGNTVQHTKTKNTVVKTVGGVQISYTGSQHERQQLMVAALTHSHKSRPMSRTEDDDPVAGSRDDDDDLTHSSNLYRPKPTTPVDTHSPKPAKRIVGLPPSPAHISSVRGARTTYARTKSGVEVAYSGLTPAQVRAARSHAPQHSLRSGDDDPLSGSVDDDPNKLHFGS